MKKKQFSQYDSLKHSEIELIGDVPARWEIRRTKDVVERIGNGVTPRGGSVVYQGEGIPFLRSQNVHDEGLQLSNVSFIPLDIHNEMKNSQLRVGDILINITGASIGRTCMVPPHLGAANISQHVVFLRVKKGFSAEYISLFLKSVFVKNYIRFEQNGASKEAFTLHQISTVPIILPDVAEQQRIIDYIHTHTARIDRKIDLLNQKAQRYAELKQALISETVTRGLDRTVPLKDSGVEWIGQIPVHWEVKRLKDIGTSIIGLTYSPDDVVDDNVGGTIVLRSSNIQNGFLDLSDIVYVKKEIPRRLTLKRGDILICSRNGSRALVGKNTCIDERMAGQTFGTFMTVYRTRYFRFLSKILNSNIFEAQSGLFMSSTVNQLTQNTLNNFLVPFPPLSEQQAISTYLDGKTAHVERIIETIKAGIEKLKELRKTLINDVVTGKIKVYEGQVPAG